LEDAGRGVLGEAFEALAFDEAEAFDRAGGLLLTARFAVRDDLREVFADFDFRLSVTMGSSFRVKDSIRCCH
jgi:hypothetical protein